MIFFSVTQIFWIVYVDVTWMLQLLQLSGIILTSLVNSRRSNQHLTIRHKLFISIRNLFLLFLCGLFCLQCFLLLFDWQKVGASSDLKTYDDVCRLMVIMEIILAWKSGDLPFFANFIEYKYYKLLREEKKQLSTTVSFFNTKLGSLLSCFICSFANVCNFFAIVCYFFYCYIIRVSSSI